MIKLKYIFGGLAAALLVSCSSTKIGLKENWIDERDVMALPGASVSEWMVKAGRPTLVEIYGDTSVYYYNYKPTMYAAAVYDSTTFFSTWGEIKETKPALANAAEAWGSRKNVLQVRVINDRAISAFIVSGNDEKLFIRDLNGNIIVDKNSGFSSNISEEVKIGEDSENFENAANSIKGQNTWPPKNFSTYQVEDTTKTDSTITTATDNTTIDSTAALQPQPTSAVVDTSAAQQPDSAIVDSTGAVIPQPIDSAVIDTNAVVQPVGADVVDSTNAAVEPQPAAATTDTTKAATP